MSKISFCAIGGLEEIGRNCYVYSEEKGGVKNHLIVDLGIGFKDDKLTSVDTFMPNIEGLKSENSKILGILITHAHEDHIGAIPYLIEQLNCPIYITNFNAHIVQEKLKQFKLETKTKIIIVETHKEYIIGSFRAKWFPISHSIIDNNMILIKTEKGNILHSGDFKCKVSDERFLADLEDLRAEEIDYFFCDSTNATVKGKSEEEHVIHDDLKKIMQNVKGSIWITLFASNLEKIRIISKVSLELKKRIVTYGRSLDTYINAGIKFNYLDPNVFVSEQEAENIPNDRLIKLATGSQGESKSALYSTLITGNSRRKMDINDILIFSSKVIPGNEMKLNKYYNALALQDINYITDRDYLIHVSGHGKQEDLKLMFETINPKWVIPIHGEVIHLKANKKLAQSLGFLSESFLLGDEIELFNGNPKVINSVNFGKLVYENFRVVSFNEPFFRERTKVFYEGAVFATVSLDKNKQLKDLQMEVLGLLTDYEIEEYLEVLTHHINSYLQISSKENSNREYISEDIRIIIRKYFKDKTAKRPIVKVHLA